MYIKNKKTKKEIFKNKNQAERKFLINSNDRQSIRDSFINPFLKSFRFHQDSILNIITHPTIKNIVFTGSSDGEICSWALHKERCIFNLKAHERSVRSLSVNYNGKFLLSCSDDNTLKLWKILENKKNPLKTIKTETSLNIIKFNPHVSCFLTGGNSITLWDFDRFVPIQQIFQKGVSVSSVKFNLLEHNIILSSASDRSIKLHDLRLHSPVKKIFLEMQTNDILWSKINPWDFIVANEDSNLYTFDIRKINQIKKVYKGHVMPVQCLDQNKKNGNIISGSLDRTIRIYSPKSDFKSDVFSSSRMARVLCVSFSSDSNLILSGSEDGNLRVWKTPIKEETLKYNSKKEFKTNNKKHKLINDLSRFKENSFLPKLLTNIRKIKTKLENSNHLKKTRLLQNLLPGTISLKDNLKKPIIRL